MKKRCCRSLPRCAACPVLAAPRARAAARSPEADLLALLRAPAPRELPPCVVAALAPLDDRRAVRRGGD